MTASKGKICATVLLVICILIGCDCRTIEDKSAFDAIELINRKVHGFPLFEGDIQQPQSKRERREIKETHLWKVKPIPYYINWNMPAVNKRAIYEAINKLSQVSCIRFTEKSIWTIKSQPDHIIFKYGVGCFSEVVGMKGGRQEVSIGRDCWKNGIPLHEILHALGFWHEHSRSDRDQYISIDYNNVRKGWEGNFGIHSESTNLGFGYDFKSLMHYGPFAFSSNGKATVVPKDSRVTLTDNTDLSDTDIAQLNALYCGTEIATAKKTKISSTTTTPTPSITTTPTPSITTTLTPSTTTRIPSTTTRIPSTIPSTTTSTTIRTTTKKSSRTPPACTDVWGSGCAYYKSHCKVYIGLQQFCCHTCSTA